MAKKSGGATGWGDNGPGVLRPSVGDNLLELGIREENVINVAALDGLMRSKSYGQVPQQGVGRVAEVGHQGAHLLLGRAELGETELVDLGDNGGDLGAGEKIASTTQDTCLVALSVDLDELGKTGLSTLENVVKADEEYGFFGDLLTALLVERVSTRLPEGVPAVVVEVREKVNDSSAMADGPWKGEDVVKIVQGDVGEQVRVVSPFWLEDVDPAGGANQAGRKHGKKADVTANVDKCVTRLEKYVHQRTRFRFEKSSRTKAVEHEPLTETFRVEVQNDVTFQARTLDVETRCDGGHSNSLVSDLRQSRRLEKGGTAQSG
jgi:hypothetical protein